jgi:hypothetical protein
MKYYPRPKFYQRLPILAYVLLLLLGGVAAMTLLYLLHYGGLFYLIKALTS